MLERASSRWVRLRAGLLRRPAAAAAGLAALIAGAAPLGDPDLPEHLALGGWILRHHAVPTVEPFAWTRAGEPYYAYSWLAQVAYHATLQLAGPLGLHALQALIGAGAVLCVLPLARRRGWERGTGAALGALNFAALMSVANELRPEQLLFLLLPLAWALADAAARAPRAPRLLAGQAAIGCLAANTHLFFPLSAAPLAMRWASGLPARRRWVLLPALALVCGWLLSPYGLSWPAVFRLNLGPNAMLLRPPVIDEMQPGFEAMLTVAAGLVLALLLLLLPWLRGARTTSAERLVEALAWAAGLGAFAFAYRLLAVWWLLLLPAMGERMRAGAAAAPARLRALAPAALGLLMLAGGMPPWPRELRLEGGVHARTLPTHAAAAVQPLAGWLARHTLPDARGRIFTAFNDGSDLTWRLPRYSVSIDSRTLFADSVAREFTWALAGDRAPHARTWRSADLALLPAWLAVGDALDADPAWVRLAATGGRRPAALWARRAWWRRWCRPVGPGAGTDTARSPSCRTGP